MTGQRVQWWGNGPQKVLLPTPDAIGEPHTRAAVERFQSTAQAAEEAQQLVAAAERRVVDAEDVRNAKLAAAFDQDPAGALELGSTDSEEVVAAKLEAEQAKTVAGLSREAVYRAYASLVAAVDGNAATWRAQLLRSADERTQKMAAALYALEVAHAELNDETAVLELLEKMRTAAPGFPPPPAMLDHPPYLVKFGVGLPEIREAIGKTRARLRDLT